ncbi:Centromere protein X, partial [Ophiophagus hannah]
MQCEMESGEECAGGFKKETMNKLLQLYFKDDKTRASGDAVLLMAEMLKIFVREAAARAAWQAQTEDVTRVEVEQVEKILPQLKPDE